MPVIAGAGETCTNSEFDITNCDKLMHVGRLIVINRVESYPLMYKSKKMKKVWIAITLATLYLFFYILAPYIGIPDEVIIVLLILSPFVIISMVYIILKYGKPSKYSFDERFYDDVDYRRSEGEG